MAEYYCEKCGKTLDGKNFYNSRNLEKYPHDGKFNLCKKCLALHVDNWDPKTYLWILQEADVPYVREEWDNLLARFCKDPSKVTGNSVLGRYFSIMNLKQWKDFHWKDNQFIQELQAKRIKEAMAGEGYSAAEISAAVEKATFSFTPDLLAPPPAPQYSQYEVAPPPRREEEDYFAQQSQLTAEELGLTDDDVTYLRIKWGKQYKPEEWIQLEQLYEEMMQSYDIQTAGHKDTLKLICKTSLKANQLVDLGDIDGYQKMSKVYDSLMRSGNFTAAQNKVANSDSIDSISELIALCEKDGFIPRYYTDGPQDKIDRVIQDMQDYTRSLIVEEMHLGGLIERAIKALEAEKEQGDIEEEDIDEEQAFEDSLFDESYNPLEPDDLIEFNEFQEAEALSDKELLESLREESDY